MLYVVGVASIKVGDIAVDGGMGTTLAALGETFEGSASLEQDDPTKTEFFSEESDDPFYSAAKAGVKRVLWSIFDWTPATLASVFGGTVTGTGDAAVWNAPDSNPTIEKSVEIITKSGAKMQFPRVSLSAKMAAALSKNDAGVIPIIGTILKPTKSGTAAMLVSKSS